MISFKIWEDDGVAFIEPNGALDAQAVPALRQAVQDATKLAPHHTIAIIDGQVIVFDAVALGALLIQHHRLQQLGGTLAVIGATGPIASLLRRASIGDSIPIFHSLDDALPALASQAGS